MLFLNMFGFFFSLLSLMKFQFMLEKMSQRPFHNQARDKHCFQNISKYVPAHIFLVEENACRTQYNIALILLLFSFLKVLSHQPLTPMDHI